MAIERTLFQVVADNAALQRQLADPANFVTRADDVDYAGIDVFQHTYDPVQWRAWTVSARNPTWKGIAGIVPAPATAQPAVAVARGGNAAVVSAPDEAARARAFLDEHPYVERMAALIDAQAPAVQRAMVLAAVGALMNGERALNVNFYAFDRCRALRERVWGYYAPADDRYWQGIPGGDIDTLVRGGVGDAGTTWRRKAANWWNSNRTTVRAGEVRDRNLVARVDFRDAVEPYAVVFGTPGGYDINNYGCRSSSGGSVGMPTGCVAPTGEQHTLWVQANGALSGGSFPPGDLDWRGWSLASIQWGGVDLFGSTAGGRYRLFAAPPLRLYWELFFWPQPEFADADGRWRNFVEWALASTAQELIRSARAAVVGRNSHQAEIAGFAAVSGLVGAAERRDIEDRQDTDRTISAVSNIFGSAAEGLSRTGVLSVASLVLGGATAVGTAIAKLVAKGAEGVNRRADVYGQLMPSFVQFKILDSRAALSDALWRGVGWPDGVVPPGLNVAWPNGNRDLVTEAMVAAAERERFQGGFVPQVAYANGSAPAAPAAPGTTLSVFAGLTALALQYAEVRVEDMPRFGFVFVDGGQVPLAGRWQDATERTWIVQAPRGVHTLRVAPPAGGGPERSRLLDVQGPVTLRFGEMAPPIPQPVRYEAPPATAPPAPPPGGAASSGTGAGRTVAAALLVTLVAGGGFAGWKYRDRLFRRAGRG